MSVAIAVAVLISILSGLGLARVGPEDAVGPMTPKRRAAWFLAGFFLWPFVAAVVVFFVVTCWDLMFATDEQIAELEEMLP